MTAAPATADSVLDDVRETLRPDRWQTAREVWQHTGTRWSHPAVRHTLRALAHDGQVEERLGGPDDRKVREYRTWK